jgi:hypothetical protein
MRALYLTLHRQWFDEIAAGTKKTEYREIKPHWQTRLEGKAYDEIHFRNGYGAERPFMRVECRGIEKNGCYRIHLGKILSIENY